MMSKQTQSRFLWMWSVGLLVYTTANIALAQEVKWIKVGSLHSWFRADGCEPEVGRTGRQFDQQDGMRWPAQFKLQDNLAAKALWIGTTDYTDHSSLGGATFPHKVVHVGPRDPAATATEFIPIKFEQITKFPPPRVFVDGEEVSETTPIFADQVNRVDPSQIPDRIIHNVVNTTIGVTEDRKILAFSQQYHDNYFIYDYTFTNTGNIDADDEIEMPGKTLTGVYFFFMYRYAVGREAAEWTVNSSRWGINAMLSTRGEDPSSGDPFRAQFAWFGRHSAVNYDCIGAPDVIYGSGRFGAPQYIGVVTLFAQKAPAENLNDPLQPATTTYEQSDDPPTQPNEQFNAARMTAEYAWMDKGHRLPRHDQVIAAGFPNQFESTPGGFMNCNGYGPYTLGPGESIRIVLAEGVNGLDRDKCIEFGRRWIKEESPYTLPSGANTTNKDDFKNAWIGTGRDSLFLTYRRAIANYDLNFNVPLPPPPPEQFDVTSGGDRIFLSWSNNAESSPGFAGYRIYRAQYLPDTTYQEIFACGSGTTHPQVVNEYEDTDPARGFDYYYYIVSFDDGTKNNTNANPKGALQSSRFYTQTTRPAKLKRQAGETLKQIRVVPNPFNARARDLQYGVGAPDRIGFLDIPGECTIKIYTERGDLIFTIEHTDGSGDAYWNSVTSSGQIVVSGVYIAIFETPGGEKAMRKFVVIR